MNILIRATNWIGDAVMSLPAVRVIHESFPGAKITVLAKPWVESLYEGERFIYRIMRLKGASGARDWAEKWELVRGLKAARFDLAVLLTNSFESAAVVRAAGVKRIIGYARDGRSTLLTQAIACPTQGEIPVHERFYYLELLRRAGLISSIPDVPEIRLEGIPQTRQRGETLFGIHGLKLPVIGVSPGAAYGGAKRWLPGRFGESAARLAAQSGGSVAVFGSAAEREICEDVARLAGGRNFGGETTLRAFIDMTAACRLFLTNDSGAMHIASAVGVPLVTVFGPTNEAATGPLGPMSRVVREPVPCAPCLLRECPIDHRCMTRVSVDQVVGAGTC